MKVYLAGRGSIATLWKVFLSLTDESYEYEEAFGGAMKVFLAGCRSRPWVFDEMKVYLARHAPWKETGLYDKTISEHHPYILESFYYADADTERLIPYFGDFMLDSGAFTFMGGFSFTSNKNVNVKYEEYLEKYADFIKRNNVNKFFELDIDSVVGYEKVKEYRAQLERLTGKQPIPVWHSTRGIEEWERMCAEYPYVAIGGIVGGEWKSSAEKYLPWFIKKAHMYKAKVHGLGYTKLSKLKKYHFDSVDSTAWTTGNRFGYIDTFKEGQIIRLQAPRGKRLGDPRAVALHNFCEWVKYQVWAEAHL